MSDLCQRCLKIKHRLFCIDCDNLKYYCKKCDTIVHSLINKKFHNRKLTYETNQNYEDKSEKENKEVNETKLSSTIVNIKEKNSNSINNISEEKRINANYNKRIYSIEYINELKNIYNEEKEVLNFKIDGLVEFNKKIQLELEKVKSDYSNELKILSKSNADLNSINWKLEQKVNFLNNELVSYKKEFENQSILYRNEKEKEKSQEMEIIFLKEKLERTERKLESSHISHQKDINMKIDEVNILKSDKLEMKREIEALNNIVLELKTMKDNNNDLKEKEKELLTENSILKTKTENMLKENISLLKIVEESKLKNNDYEKDINILKNNIDSITEKYNKLNLENQKIIKDFSISKEKLLMENQRIVEDRDKKFLLDKDQINNLNNELLRYRKEIDVMVEKNTSDSINYKNELDKIRKYNKIEVDTIKSEIQLIKNRYSLLDEKSCSSAETTKDIKIIISPRRFCDSELFISQNYDFQIVELEIKTDNKEDIISIRTKYDIIIQELLEELNAKIMVIDEFQVTTRNNLILLNEYEKEINELKEIFIVLCDKLKLYQLSYKKFDILIPEHSNRFNIFNDKYASNADLTRKLKNEYSIIISNLQNNIKNLEKEKIILENELEKSEKIISNYLICHEIDIDILNNDDNNKKNINDQFVILFSKETTFEIIHFNNYHECNTLLLESREISNYEKIIKELKLMNGKLIFENEKLKSLFEK